MQWVFGCSVSVGHGQGTFRECGFTNFTGTPDTNLLADGGASDYPIAHGFAVVRSTLTNNGNNMNTVVQAETMMMVKEHIVEKCGRVRYMIGQGGSGGSIAQHAIANQYPGQLDGSAASSSS